MTADPFAGIDLEARIAERAARCGIELHVEALREIAAHARAVLSANPELSLTRVVDPDEFLERHIGESFEGATMLPAGTAGTLVDLGSGNGYPGLPIAAARRLLEPVLVEASTGKARFLRALLNDVFRRGAVLEEQLQRASDAAGLAPVRVIATRAMGNWERVLPRLTPLLGEDGEILLWAGERARSVLGRTAWRSLKLRECRPLPGRERSWIWRLGLSAPVRHP